MVKSMTGFGRSTYTENGTSITAEVHSVNGRFFDMRVKLPRSLNEYESELRKIALNYIKRGRVTLTISLDQAGSRVEEMAVDFDVADRYLSLAEEMSSRYGIDNNMDARTLMSLPEIISWKENGTDADKVWEITKKAVTSAFELLEAMREVEGTAIRNDLSARLKAISCFIEDIEKKSPEILESNIERMRKKIENLVGEKALDENRFAMEVALYAERVDITEECVRIKSHIVQFAQELTLDKTSGRKLTFILQEMNREANTIGSKIMDANIVQTVVRIKEELEKMREQAENME
ncbi:YicC/YloC family endoribonuclease [Candidatus Latescibacterota bacterium]